MQTSARYFGFPFDLAGAQQAIDTACAALPDGMHRLKLTLSHDGRFQLVTAPLVPLIEPVRLLVAGDATGADDLFLRHKTSIRARYDAAWRDAEANGCFDTLFFNQDGELTEGGRSNVFVKLADRWYTPPLSCGVLPGVMRSVVLSDPAWNAVERVITREMFASAAEIMVCNALRGAIKATIAS